MKLKTATALALATVLAGCSTVTIHPKDSPKFSSAPTYEDSRPFYLGGLVGEERVDVKEVCANQDVKQMQSQQTFTDGLLTVVTLGIYAPHTVKVWCE